MPIDHRDLADAHDLFDNTDQRNAVCSFLENAETLLEERARLDQAKSTVNEALRESRRDLIHRAIDQAILENRIAFQNLVAFHFKTVKK